MLSISAIKILRPYQIVQDSMQTIKHEDSLIKKKFLSELSRILYYGAELKRTFIFPTNDFSIKADDFCVALQDEMAGRTLL